CPARASCRARGFSLVELAVALFVITLLVGSLLVPLTTQVEQRQISDTQKALEDIKEALLGFALSNGFLPCPDVTSGTGANDGAEDVSGAGTCVSSEGNVPWTTLGVIQSDVWGNRFRYRVDATFAQHPPAAPFTLSSNADIRVCGTAACTTLLTSSSPNGAAAVVLSHGKNGYGAMNSQTGVANTVPSSADELENTNGNTTFVSRTPSAVGAAAGEFDDIVTWLSKYSVFNRMVSAGKLP
ncbi:MAG TPA: type II secretion system protein, partial [Burkholderiales bacterium]|nr:type II secretion system protein [Burkholderiales bacterium]